MARTYTRAELRTRAREYADHLNDSFPADSVYNDLMDVAYARLWELLADAGIGYFAEATPDQWTTDGITGSHSLPAGFGRLLDVEYRVDSTHWVPVPRCDPGVQWRFTTTPPSGRIYRARYLAAPDKLASDAATVEGVAGYEDYIPLDVAAKVKIKEESDARPLLALRAEILERIEFARMQRIMHRPYAVRDADADAARRDVTLWTGANHTFRLNGAAVVIADADALWTLG